MSLWAVIAKNEQKLRTHRFRNNRVKFFIILYTSLILWALLLSPLLFNLFMPNLAAGIPDLIYSVGLIIEYMMMAFFLSILIYPLNNVYRKTEIGFKEILLSSPATAGDIFLGEFLGKLPIYLGGVLVFAPILIGILNPIVNLSLVQYAIIYMSIFGLVFLGTLLGNILASLLEHKIARNERYRDISKVLMFLLSIALIAMIYSLQFLFDFLKNNPELRNWVMFYPSLWYSNIILYFLDPTLIGMYILNIWISSFLAIMIPLFILYIAYRKAETFFTLEGGIERISTVIEHENIFYLLIRKITGHKWEGLVITQLKEFLRKRENIMKIIYVSGLTGVLGIIFSLTIGSSLEAGAFASSILVVILITIGGMLYGLMFGSYIFVGTKDLLWVYKRSPRNVPVIIYSYIFAMLIFNVLITLGLTIFFTIFLNFSLFTSIFFFLFYLINCEVVLFQSIGIQCLNPSFEEKGKNMSTNIITLILIQMVPFQLLFVFLILYLPVPTTSELAKIFMLGPILLISIGIAIPLLYYGIKKLNRTE